MRKNRRVASAATGQHVRAWVDRTSCRIAALLAALEAGLPDCAGVALGFDRVLMFLLGLPDIQSAISFPAGS